MLRQTIITFGTTLQQISQSGNVFPKLHTLDTCSGSLMTLQVSQFRNRRIRIFRSIYVAGMVHWIVHDTLRFFHRSFSESIARHPMKGNRQQQKQYDSYKFCHISFTYNKSCLQKFIPKSSFLK